MNKPGCQCFKAAFFSSSSWTSIENGALDINVMQRAVSCVSCFVFIQPVYSPFHTTNTLSSICCQETEPGIYGEHKNWVHSPSPIVQDLQHIWQIFWIKKGMFSLYKSLDPVFCASSQRIVHASRCVSTPPCWVEMCRSVCSWCYICVCTPVCIFGRVCVHWNLPALKHQQQITDGPPALEVFYFPEEARYVKNKHVQH